MIMSAEHRGPDDIERRLAELNKEIAKQHQREQRTRERLARKQRPRGRRSRWAMSALAAVVIIGGSIYLSVANHSGSALPGDAQTPLSGPPADPFTGSPANNWADGATGISLPAPIPNGPFTVAQVRSAYTTTRDLLIAQDLDWPTLRGGFPSAFEHALPSWNRSQFVADLDKKGSSNSRSYVTTFAPGTTQFVTQVVKVHGSLGETMANDSGTAVLRIQFDYLFTYAVEPPGNPDEWMRVVQQRYGYLDFAAGNASAIYDFSLDGSVAGVACGTTDGYIHPDFPQGPPSSVQPSGSPVNPYSLATPGAGGRGSGCQPTTGT
jgi:hypothetical protein